MDLFGIGLLIMKSIMVEASWVVEGSEDGEAGRRSRSVFLVP